MLFTEFKNYAKENIINYLTPDYVGAEMNIRTINKSNGYSYEALSISKPGEKCSIIPALDLTRAYKEYQQGADLDEIIEKLADIRMNAKLDGFNKESILTFEGIKSHILPRLINTANNATYLENKPHLEIADLSVMFVVRVNETVDSVADAPIDYDLMTLWGVDLDTVKATAFENIAMQKPVFMSIAKAIFEGKMNEDIFDLDNIDPKNEEMPLYLLSNRYKHQGASIIFNKALMHRIADKMGSFYILPSSIHEVLIIPTSAGNDVKELAKVVKQVNATELSPQDILSDNVYEFDIEDDTIKIA